MGASVSSIGWMSLDFSLSFGGSLLAPFCEEILSWQIRNVFLCVTMWFISGHLALLEM